MANTTPIVTTVTKTTTKEMTPKESDAAPKGTLLAKIILKAETALATLKNHMVTLAPPTGKGPDMDITIPSNMTRVPRSVAKHHINIREGYSPVRLKKRARPWNVPKPSKRRKLNLSAATPLSASWMLTEAIAKYKWRNQMKRKWLSTPAMKYIATPKCPSILRTLVPHTNGWWTKLLITKTTVRDSQCHAVRILMANHASGRTGKGQVFDSRYGLFYEVDRGESHGNNHLSRHRIAVIDTMHNDEELRLNLDLLEEGCEQAAIREAKPKLKMTQYYNARVRGVTFRLRDFVYHSNNTSHAIDGGRLGLKWEGPYEVTEALGDGAYKLRSIDEEVLPKMCNIVNLKKC
nr:reverse transcriptase domain-containing protein [Tanacetum cinerariifolium]